MLRTIGILALTAIMGALPAQADSPASHYRLDTGDTVSVTVYGHDDLSGEFEVDGAGRISLPLIKKVEAVGRTSTELEAVITDALRPDYLKNPRVSVSVLNYRPFYIMGEVINPGSYPYMSGMRIVNAVAVAGGYTYRAKKSKIKITRGTGSEKVSIYAAPETPVQPGDIIEVPERFF